MRKGVEDEGNRVDSRGPEARARAKYAQIALVPESKRTLNILNMSSASRIVFRLIVETRANRYDSHPLIHRSREQLLVRAILGSTYPILTEDIWTAACSLFWWIMSV